MVEWRAEVRQAAPSAAAPPAVRVARLVLADSGLAEPAAPVEARPVGPRAARVQGALPRVAPRARVEATVMRLETPTPQAWMEWRHLPSWEVAPPIRIAFWYSTTAQGSSAGPDGCVAGGRRSRSLPCAVESEQSPMPARDTTQRLSGRPHRRKPQLPGVLPLRRLHQRHVHAGFRLFDTQSMHRGGCGRPARLRRLASHLFRRVGSRTDLRSHQGTDELLRRLL